MMDGEAAEPTSETAKPKAAPSDRPARRELDDLDALGDRSKAKDGTEDIAAPAAPLAEPMGTRMREAQRKNAPEPKSLPKMDEFSADSESEKLELEEQQTAVRDMATELVKS